MSTGMNGEGASPTRETIEQDLVSLIAKINILNLMTEGMSRGDDRVGIAYEEIGRQLDEQARLLLDAWERFSESLPEDKGGGDQENGFL